MNPLLLIGGGMISRLQVLPSLYQMQRAGTIGEILVTARSEGTLQALSEDAGLRSAFPDQGFQAHAGPERYKELLDELPEQSVVYIAIPDQNHYEVLCECLERNHHVVCVKPLVLSHDHAEDVRRRAWDRGLFVGVEYHKR